MPNPESHEPGQENLLDRETPLTIEEISQVRSKSPFSQFDRSYKKMDYHFGDVSISILRQSISPEDFEKNKDKILALHDGRENAESFGHETLLVNALIEQNRIAKMFGVDSKDLWSSCVADYSHSGKAMMDNMGDNVYMLSLDEHVKKLEKDGATNEQVIIEIAGQMFHESIHQNEPTVRKELLRGKASLGELTPITAQLAYYLAIGYTGPKGYDAYSCSLGIEDIKKGKDLEKNHEIATSVSAELLLEQLKSVYPDIAEGVDIKSSLDACETIVVAIPPERRRFLMPALKEAILQSTDEKKSTEVVKRLKQKGKKQK